MSDYVQNRVQFEYADIEEAFPNVDSQHMPCGEFVLLQVRAAKGITGGGIILSDESKAVERDNTQVAKVIAVGPVAFHNRTTSEPWACGPWYKVGDFVRIPRYGGDRWHLTHERKEPEKKKGGIVIPSKSLSIEVEFALFRDTDIRSVITGDPLRVKAFL